MYEKHKWFLMDFEDDLGSNINKEINDSYWLKTFGPLDRFG